MKCVSAWGVRACVGLLVCAAGALMVGQEPRHEQVAAAKVEEPQLIPTEMPLTPTEKCKKARENTIYFSLVIDQKGAPQQIRLLNALGTDEDLFAIEAVRKDHFIPARQGGAAKRVKRSMAVVVDTCVEKAKDAGGNKFDRLRLVALPKQTLQPARDSEPILEVKGEETAVVAKVGGAVSAPTPILTPNAIYTADARKRKVEGECFIRLIVDAQGFPQNPQVVRPLDPGLDAAALEAVRHYRFNPAVKKGAGPVPVAITVAVNFRLY